MTLNRIPRNPIEQRKHDVRVHARNGALSVGVGVVGGVALLVLTHSWFWIVLGLIVAVGGGVTSWLKIQKIVNHVDKY